MSLKKSDFQQQLQELCVGCTKVKPATARNKAHRFYNKFFAFIAENEQEIHGLKSAFDLLTKENEALKKGVVYAEAANYCNDSKLSIRISEISAVHAMTSTVQVYMKTGELHELPKKYEFLTQILR